MPTNKQAGANVGTRVPIKTAGTEKLVGVASEYALPGVRWHYYNTTTQLLKYTFEWPEGFAAHFAWPGDGQWRVINLWSDTARLEQFFGEVAIHRISQAIALLGAVPNKDGATDVEPVHHEATNFILGPRARSFAGTTEDKDGEAIHVLGGEPIAIELEVNDLRPEDYATLIERIGYNESVPSELISHHATIEDDGMRIFETWTGRGHALAALGATLMPAVERLGAEQSRDLLCIHQEHAMRRIALRPDAISAFGF